MLSWRIYFHFYVFILFKVTIAQVDLSVLKHVLPVLINPIIIRRLFHPAFRATQIIIKMKQLNRGVNQ